MSELNPKFAAAIKQSLDYLIGCMINEGVPVGIDALRIDLSYHTARGWQPTLQGQIVEIPEDLPEPGRQSQMS